MHYADSFSRIVLFSPAVEVDLLLNKTNGNTERAVPSILFDTMIGTKEAYDASPRLNPLRGVETALEDGKGVQPIWMCCGEDDPLVVKACKHFSGFLTAKGVAHTFVGGKGEHDLIYWDKHLEEAFRFLADKI